MTVIPNNVSYYNGLIPNEMLRVSFETTETDNDSTSKQYSFLNGLMPQIKPQYYNDTSRFKPQYYNDTSR